MKTQILIPVLVDEIPPKDEMQQDYLYISHKYGTAVHYCACGCGEEVVTPLSQEGWSLHFTGRFSLTPSIGNFQYPCRSHYFITNERICWCNDDFESVKDTPQNKKKKAKHNKNN
ncbi:MAG: hypothetical protein K2K97_06745 [Muribaculaceae bacterium]|nr:hypothetical protein [Muribaculaceae bacterium]